MQSQDERDTEGLAARRERESVVKEPTSEEITGRYEGEELALRRADRPEYQRIGILEKKHDDLKNYVEKKHDELKSDVAEVRTDVKTVSSQVSDLRAGVAGAVGKLDGQESVLSELLTIVKTSAERDHVSFTARVEVDKAHELAQVEVGKAHELAVIEVHKEHEVDTVKAVADRRKRNLKILGIGAGLVAGGGSVVELLHRLGVL